MWQRSVCLLSVGLMTEKLSQESLNAVGKQASWPDAIQTRCLQRKASKDHFRLPAPQVPVTSWKCTGEHWHGLVNPGLREGLGCGSLFVLQVALQRGSSLPLVSLQAGCEHCFSSAALGCCFLWWHLGLNSRVPLPFQLMFVLQELLWEVFCCSQREGIAEANPLLAVSPAQFLLHFCSLFKAWICKTCDMGNVPCPHVPFPNQTLAFRTGFITQLCTLWSDVLNTLALVPELLFTSEDQGCCHKCGVVITSGVFAQWCVHNVVSNWWCKRCLFCCWPFLLLLGDAVPWVPSFR